MTAQQMEQRYQDQYAGMMMALRFMVGELATVVDDATNPEDATYSELAEITHLYNQVTRTFNAVFNKED